MGVPNSTRRRKRRRREQAEPRLLYRGQGHCSATTMRNADEHGDKTSICAERGEVCAACPRIAREAEGRGLAHSGDVQECSTNE